MEKAKKTGRYPYGSDEEIMLRVIMRQFAVLPIADIAKDLGIGVNDVKEIISEYETEAYSLTLDYVSKNNIVIL